MKRMKIMGLALVAVFAMTAFAASSAMALPEVGRCIAGSSSSKYSDSNCNVKGAFEFVKTIVKNKFTSAGGEGVLETTSGTKVVCKTQSATGEYKAGGKEVTNVVAKFQGCAIPALGITCKTKGAPEGEIVTNPLGGKLGYILKSAQQV